MEFVSLGVYLFEFMIKLELLRFCVWSVTSPRGSDDPVGYAKRLSILAREGSVAGVGVGGGFARTGTAAAAANAFPAPNQRVRGCEGERLSKKVGVCLSRWCEVPAAEQLGAWHV